MTIHYGVAEIQSKLETLLVDVKLANQLAQAKQVA